MHSFSVFVLCLLSYIVESTDLAATYKHGILLLKNADQVSEYDQDAKGLKIQLPHHLDYPMGLAHEPFEDKFYVSDVHDNYVDIFSVSIEGSNVIEPLVSKTTQSMINDITYDPSLHQLIWTDSLNLGIFMANLSESNDGASSSSVLTTKNVRTPRGIALDYCNRILYWTDRDKDSPSIETYDMDTKSRGVLKKREKGDTSTFYQTINYNDFHNELIWAETVGDELGTGCKIIAKSLLTAQEAILGTFENCYPFSITSDEDHIYWSDWGQEGVMRISRRDPMHSLVKLISTPPVQARGKHHGAFAVTTLQHVASNETTRCNNPKSSIQLESSRKPTKEAVKNESFITNKGKMPMKETVEKKESLVTKTSRIPTKEIVPKEESFVTDSKLPIKQTVKNEESSVTKDVTIPMEEVVKNEENSVTKESTLIGTHAESVSSAATSLSNFATYRSMRLAIVFLSFVCVFLLLTTLVLLARLTREWSLVARYIAAVKEHFAKYKIVAVDTPSERTEKKKGSPRKFGPKPKPVEGQLCPRTADDGVKIDIEDCCQMTLCETPCYTSLKKEGKGYKLKTQSNRGDKQSLLDEMHNV